MAAARGITQAGSTESEHKTERNRAAQAQTDKDINKKDQQNNMNRSNRTETHTERIIQKTQDEQSRTNTNRSGQEPKGNTEGHEQKKQSRHRNRTEQAERTGHTAMGTLQWATCSQKLVSQRSLAGLKRAADNSKNV